MSIQENLAALEGYNASRSDDFVIAKHSSAVGNKAKGYTLVGEIADGSPEPGGTMQVWDAGKAKAAARAEAASAVTKGQDARDAKLQRAAKAREPSTVEKIKSAFSGKSN